MVIVLWELITMTKYTNTFIQEFYLPLENVQRPWLRRSATLVLALFVFIVAGIDYGYREMCEFIEECW